MPDSDPTPNAASSYYNHSLILKPTIIESPCHETEMLFMRENPDGLQTITINDQNMPASMKDVKAMPSSASKITNSNRDLDNIIPSIKDSKPDATKIAAEVKVFTPMNAVQLKKKNKILDNYDYMRRSSNDSVVPKSK